MIVLCGSIAEYRASPQTWRHEPSATLYQGLTGDAFDHCSDAAERFVREHWVEIEALAARAGAT